MKTIRRSHERGYADGGWLQSFHSFSFADYYDPRHVQFGPLSVTGSQELSLHDGKLAEVLVFDLPADV